MGCFQAIFIDDGGVLNDNALREPQWRELDAQFYGSRYGGNHDAWKEASRVAFEEMVKIWKKTRETRETDHQAFMERATKQVMATLFDQMGISPPPLQEQYKVSREADEWITPRLKTACPGAISGVRQLKELGYSLYMASGSASWMLRGFLTGMGIVECFEELYGPDLINTMKTRPLFYRRIFDHVGIRPENALVVDDQPVHVSWATEVGATAVLVSPTGFFGTKEGIHSIPRLDGLPRLLRELV